METISIKPQTVIMFVGPTHCGKSHFAQNVLMPELFAYSRLTFKKLNIQYLSSDMFRDDLLGEFHEPGHHKEHETDFVSEQAFTLLKAKLAAVTSYPVNADFVVIDTTGMSEAFRAEVKEITYKANYNLQLFVFEYKNRDDYYKYTENVPHTRIKKISDSIKRFKDKLRELNKKDYPNQTKIKSNNFEVKIEIEDFKSYTEHFLDSAEEYIVIGDVHGCFDELKELLCAHGFVFDSNNFVVEAGRSKVTGEPLKIIFIGDLIDKGDQIVEVINFVDYLIYDGFAVLIRGNHENFVYNYLKGVDSYRNLERKFIDTFLNSVQILEADEKLCERFFNMFENAKDFYATDRFIVTHAPCKTEYLGKVRTVCLKNQRNFRFARRADFQTEEEFIDNAEKEMSFLKTDARYNHPYHIMGHVMLSNVVQFNNKVMIDTGCVAGGKLTSVTVNIDAPLHFKSVKSKRQPTGEIFPLFMGAKRFDISELDPKLQTRIKYLCIDKVNFISGTMAPADKDQQSNVLESLTQAIQYYKNAGVKKLILQPKYMGSRGNVYLFRELEKCYIVSRNGYKLKDSTLEVLRPALQKLIDRMFNMITVEGREIKLFILDAEILPWNLVGSGLITKQFKPVSVGVQSETDLLIQHGFETVLEDFKQNELYQQYLNDRRRNALTKDQLTEVYGHTRERTFRALYEYKHLQLEEEKGYVDGFTDQLSIHAGEDKEPNIKPFSILKHVYNDDTEYVYETDSNIDMYEMVSTDPYAILDFEKNVDARMKYPEIFNGTDLNEYLVDVHLNNGDDKVGGNTATGFFTYLTSIMKMEGIVIKPERIYTPSVAPYIKVRNEDYLTIVYGHNYKFEHKFNKLISKKGVKKKLQTSIREFELGLKMLKTPYAMIAPENEEYKQLLAQMIVEVEKEKQLDPRL